MKCSICNNTLKGKYCEKCGQEYTNKKLSLKALLNDILASVTNIEKSIFLNIYAIIRHPKKVVCNYWEGYRGHFYKPGKMLFYFVTVAGLSILLLEKELFGLSYDYEGLTPKGLLFSITFFPVLNLATFLTYRKYKRNYLEHLAATIYIVSTFGILVLILQNVFVYTNISDHHNGGWFLLLIALTLIWNALLFTTPAQPLRVVVNIILELIVLSFIIGVLVYVLYLLGFASIE